LLLFVFILEWQVMENCAFVKDFLGFHRCIYSLMKDFDLRAFFGGMDMYHNGEAMARTLGVPNPQRFASDFVYGMNGDSDPIMLPSKIQTSRGGGSSSDTEFCLSLRVWDILLWFAIIGRPRRDVSIMSDFSKTLAQYSLQLLPRQEACLHAKLRVCVSE
jgi:hypothetical protein